ncbi:MAG: NADH-quinone oxidoreductase subunit C [Chitinophagales bacterium]|nr:NADH-quinone oxidoreductase subunit C [Chitinophagales bacterium]
MMLTNELVQQKLTAQFGEAITAFEEPWGMLTFEVKSSKVLEVMQWLRDNEEMGFTFLTDVCGAHFPDNTVERQFATIYHMHNWVANVRIRFKAFLHGENPEVQSVTSLFNSANWQERETYDFYGITFKGHPDLKRILNMDEMVSFPLRKEYPLEDAGRTDKDDRYFGREPQKLSVN